MAQRVALVGVAFLACLLVLPSVGHCQVSCHPNIFGGQDCGQNFDFADVLFDRSKGGAGVDAADNRLQAGYAVHGHVKGARALAGAVALATLAGHTRHEPQDALHLQQDALHLLLRSR